MFVYLDSDFNGVYTHESSLTWLEITVSRWEEKWIVLGQLLAAPSYVSKYTLFAVRVPWQIKTYFNKKKSTFFNNELFQGEIYNKYANMR